MATTEAVQTRPARRYGRVVRFASTLALVLGLLFGVPWWTLVVAGAQWPTPVVVAGTVVFVGALAALPVLMVLGHGRRHLDWAAATGDTMLGVIWVLFAWAVLGNVLRPGAARRRRRRPDPVAHRRRRGGRRRRRPGALGRTSRRCGCPGSSGSTWSSRGSAPAWTALRVVLLTDTHYGPIDRARWSAGVVDAVNRLDADIVCHTGDIADGTVAQRREQAAPLGRGPGAARPGRTSPATTSTSARPQGWLDHMRELGWEPLHNRHIVVERGGARLVVAGVDDRTAGSSGRPGHRADHAAALAGADPDLPVLLLAHQPKQIDRRGHARRRPADLRAHPRRADLAVPLPGATRPAGGAAG